MKTDANRAARFEGPMRVLLGATIVCLVLALFPFTQNPATPIKYLLLSWGTLLAAVVWLLGGIFGGVRARCPSFLFYVLLIFLVNQIVSGLSSSFPIHAVYTSQRFVVFALVYLLTAQCVREERHAWRLMAVACVALTLSSLYGFCQKLGWDPFPWSLRNVEEYTGIPATFGNPNFAAHALLLGIVMAIGLALRPESRGVARALWVLVASALTLHFLLTGIRSGLAAFAAAIALVAVAGIVRRHTKRPVRGAYTICIVVIVLGGVACLLVSGATKLRTGSAAPLDTSLILRYNSNHGAARMIADRPLLGYGPGNYVIENVPYWTPYEQDWFAVERKYNLHVHNDYLETAVDAGLPALFLYLAFLTGGVVYALTESLRTREAGRRRLAYVLAACFFAFAVEGLFGFNVRVPVSGALLFMLAGVLEGTGMAGRCASPNTTPCELSRRRSLALHAGAVALAILVTATQIQTFAAQYFFQRGRGAQHWGRADAAHACFSKAARLAPWEWNSLWELGITESDLGRPEAAVDCFERALEVNPYCLMARVSLSNAYLDLASSGNAQAESMSKADLLDLAQRHAGNVLEYCPKLPEAHVAAGRAWSIRALQYEEQSTANEARKAWLEAINHFKAALRTTSDARSRGRTQRKLAVAWTALGESEPAEAALLAAVESAPADRKAWTAFLDHARTTGEYETLIRSLRRARERLEQQGSLNPQSLVDLNLLLTRALVERSDVLANAGKHAAALTSAREALRQAPNDVEVRWAVARRLAEAGRHAEARLEYRVLLESAMLTGEARLELQREVDALNEAAGGKSR